MKDSTKKIFIGVAIIALLSSVICCMGGIAFFGLLGSTATEVRRTTTVTTWQTRLEALQKAGAPLPSSLPPNNPKMSQADDTVDDTAGTSKSDLSPNQHPRTLPEWLSTSPEQSALYFAIILTRGDLSALSQSFLVGEVGELGLVSLLGHFQSCGELTAINPVRYTYDANNPVFAWMTRLGCRLEVQIEEVSRKEKTYYTAKTLKFDRPGTSPPWLVWLDPQEVDIPRARKLSKKHHSKKHGPELAYKVRKARQAGMKARHYYVGDVVGRTDLVKEFVPDLGKPLRSEIRKMSFPPNTSAAVSHYRVGSATYEYKVFVQTINEDPDDHDRPLEVMVIGETIDIMGD